MLLVRAMLTPLATRLPAAFTRLIADAFCSAAPASVTLEDRVVLMAEWSDAMLFADAESMDVAPSTVSTTWLFFTLLLEKALLACMLRLATVDVDELFTALLLRFSEKLLAEFEDELLAIASD